FGTDQSRRIGKFKKVVEQVNHIETSYEGLSDEEIKGKVVLFRTALQGGKLLDDLLPEAYALVKNVCRRLCGTEVRISGYCRKWDMIPYDVQILGAIAMHYGNTAEMMTGEGKTLTATMPLFLNALTGKSVHLVTVNDYLAKRDCEWVGAIFRFLGLTVHPLTQDVPLEKRKEVYEADVVYGTASEFGFDYLRDNSMAHSVAEQCQRGFYYAVIDEVDSVLIDEARTPLIISGPSADSFQMYDELRKPVERLVRLQHALCNKLAGSAYKTLEQLGKLKEEADPPRLSKEEAGVVSDALRDLWLVGKGVPRHKILKRVKEHPDLRYALEEEETYLHAEANKKEKEELLAKLYIVIDERASDYELTDRGIELWTEGRENATNDFIMSDLGHEYALIDQDEAMTEAEKLEKKNAVREEDARCKERVHNLRQLLRAHLLMERDVDYIVEKGKVIIIDENTGRPQPGRRFADGLHQAIEAKESVAIQRETQTYATITLQNYFRMYDKLAGMTGTAMTEANELKEIYGLDVLAIPTHRKCLRKDEDDAVYMTEREKYGAIIRDIRALYDAGRPVLIGTESVDASEKLSRILKGNHLPHTVLNAKNHETEAEIIAKAGQKGAITVATNMAGRGTDIKLEKGASEAGGLHVIGTTRHRSRRIDRQLRGRCARLGDPGSSKFYISFEDSLIRLFTSPKLTAFLKRFRPPEGEPISAKVLNRSIETAQKRVEERNYSMRKHTLEYDDVMNKQRKEVYAFRNEILREDNMLKVAYEVIEAVCSRTASDYFHSRLTEEGWDPAGYRRHLMSYFPVSFEESDFTQDGLTIEEIETGAAQKVIAALDRKVEYEAGLILAVRHDREEMPPPETIVREVIRTVLLGYVDRLWQNHLLAIDHLRSEVMMRVVGQKDPLLEFKHEAFALFDEFNGELRLKMAQGMFTFGIVGHPLPLPPSPPRSPGSVKGRRRRSAKVRR
ncbi:MAG: preprotein translocase subunit SecA, partial [Simkaniaceae bacterium]|nr:preprotein translocase subunit SecA [Simkaniaceae bacterium]